MDILKFVDMAFDIPYQEWFTGVQGDDWFLNTGSIDNHTGSLYGEFGFFCFFDTQEI